MNAPAPASSAVRDACGQAAAPPGSKRRRIGYLLRTYPRFSQTFIVNEILELERREVPLGILALRRPDEGLFHECVSRVRTAADYLPERRWALWKKTWRTLGRHARGWSGADVRELIGLWARRRAGLLDTLQALGVLRWARKNKVAHVHVHFGGEEAGVALLAHTLGGLSYSLTLHAFDIFRRNVDRRLLTRKINAARFVVTVSEFNRKFLIDHLPQVEASRIRVCYNGVDLDRFQPGDAPRAPDLVIAVGRLTAKKGFVHLVNAIALLRRRGVRMRCRIGGTGPEEQPLRERIEQLDLQDQVELLGDLKQDQVATLMRQATCLVLPCVAAADGNMDALPTVLLESMACGCPTISTTLSGIPEIIEHDISGLLAPPGDEAALAEAIAAVAQDPGRAQALAAGGRRRAEERFDVRRNAAVLAGWLKEASRQTPPAQRAAGAAAVSVATAEGS